ncbi:MAG: SIR2 family protein [Bacteroidales bacterium]|nr:SIR2 family protein [Bacteroidales bacterium]
MDIHNLDEVIEKILEGNCLLFLGSGFSAGAYNIMDEKMPVGGGLAQMLDEKTGEDNNGDLEESAESYIDKFGEVNLSQLLRNTFSVKAPSDGQKAVCGCKWRRIYTTNYDNSVEQIMAKDGKQYLSVTLSSDSQDYVNKREIVVHLNGSVYNLSTGTMSTEFKLISGSYLTQQFLDSSWQNLFQYDIKDSDLIVFIGFSLRYDLDIKRIIWEDGDTRKKCVFIMADGENHQSIKKANRFGASFPIGLEAFGKKIIEAKRLKPVVVTKLNRPLLCFRTPSIQNTSVAKIPDSSITDLFLFGKVDDMLLQKSSEYPDKLYYYINRNELEAVLKQLENGARNILVHSDLGNGKTLFIKGLMLRLLKEGYKVYEYTKFYASLTDEIERICNEGDPNTVIIVENYNANRRIVETIQTYRSKQRLIVSERSVTNDMSYDWLRDIVKHDFYEVDVNRLNDAEINQCMSILNQFGLWREYSDLRYDKKIELLKGHCKSSLKLILLDVINSSDIRKRIEGDIKKIKADRDIYQAMVLMLVSNLLDWNISLDDISYALGNTIKGNASFRRNEVVKEYIDFGNAELKVKSSILSEVILTHIMDVDVVRETLVKAFRNFDKNLGEPEYRKYMITILSYASLQRLFNKEEGDEFNSNIVVLFEDIRSCKFCENNPHYWLQYAIAKLGEQKYDEAKMYFDNAYSFAKRRDGFDTYQIDNHYARYLLENVIYTNADEEYFKAFRQAHGILTDKSHLKDTKYYPFKVARSYLPFYHKFKTRMDKQEQSFFYQACLQIDGMIKSYMNAIPAYRTKHEVRDAEIKIGQILDEMGK